MSPPPRAATGSSSPRRWTSSSFSWRAPPRIPDWNGAAGLVTLARDPDGHAVEFTQP